MTRLGRVVATFFLAALIGGIAWADWKFNPHTGKLDYYEATGSVTDNSIVNADVNSAANIDGSKLADNTIAPGKLQATGTPGTTTYFRGDGSWSTPTGSGSTPVAFNIPDVTNGDVFYPQRFITSVTIDNVSGYASVDNVVGYLAYCANDNIANCTKINNSDWTITNATSVFSTASFDNAVIPARYILKWSTTSAGTAANVLSVWVEFH